MDCMQFEDDLDDIREIVEFQYRKRYGLHAMKPSASRDTKITVSIPQAVWIACNSGVNDFAKKRSGVSIPQAVWIACNEYAIVGQFVALVSIPQAVLIACNFIAAFLSRLW